MKYLLVLVGVVAFVWFVLLRPKLKKSPNVETSKRADSKRLQGEMMVECALCGSFVSQNDALQKGEVFYCSQECLQKATKC
ncbi:hypothetical protein CQA49_02370 [Helicobacter sp. MIT 00-7814]|uniref:PP0621 family protein n=1 Tax=unclassified Helicobacter TaxID=2593540 RepID=UPI000E1E9E32|nr:MULTISPECIES: PP0621 family protein [unclassified Helicobacter]RDU55234.1 hypothetical protein CQA37_04060 [Helicobacter sp. MIT 99-10781]RDU56072.1 hypothetical protein CQA49_02370 [Helicobacter sp. MIT 00-7814]